MAREKVLVRRTSRVPQCVRVAIQDVRRAVPPKALGPFLATALKAYTDLLHLHVEMP
eukprot:COSAG03_NODE_712_length_6155_cov_2.285832_3_plen_57_part_00